jgi:hypothetical protein
MTTSDSAMSPEQQLSLSPNLLLADRKVNRYPNQFFDLSQQYMPPTIKELFRWCTFYYYNSPLLGSAIKKMTRYPITDLIIEDNHEPVRQLWDTVLNKNLKMKARLIEVNQDLGVYGNSFVSLHLPFTRMLKCKKCGNSAPIKEWDWRFASNYHFLGKCNRCGDNGELDVKDVPFKDPKKIRLLRWNPENFEIKYNEYTGNKIYLYTVPRRLRMAVQAGDKDIVQDLPLIVINAVKDQKKIRMNQDNFFHLQNPTLAEQDQGWGKPVIIHVLKDMFYFYTLRRAQEAIAMEHIIPFDIIYPMPNAQMDPYVHSDLSSWKNQITTMIDQHRRDPNFKAVIPIPVGFGRLGGDGKALLLGPELQYLTQTIIAGMGIPQDFVLGGLNWTGSSVSLRTLENDFIQARCTLLELTNWIKDKIRIWMNYPDVGNIKFADFRMADDIQRNQQLIGLNASGKVSAKTMLTELGYDYEAEQKNIIEEMFVQNYITDIMTKGQARSQGEASVISYNFQQKLERMTAQAQHEAQSKVDNALNHDNSGQIAPMVQKLTQMDPVQAEIALSQLKQQVPEIASAIEQAYHTIMDAQKEQQQQQMQAQQQQEMQMQDQQTQMQQQGAQSLFQNQVDIQNQQAQQKAGLMQPQQAGAKSGKPAKGVDMKPTPDQKPPRRQGGV